MRFRNSPSINEDSKGALDLVKPPLHGLYPFMNRANQQCLHVRTVVKDNNLLPVMHMHDYIYTQHYSSPAQNVKSMQSVENMAYSTVLYVYCNTLQLRVS